MKREEYERILKACARSITKRLEPFEHRVKSVEDRPTPEPIPGKDASEFSEELIALFNETEA